MNVMEILISALITVESGGDPNVLGRAGELGVLQILPAYWQDGCEELGVDFKSSVWDYKTNVRDIAKSKAVTLAYLKRYGRAYKKHHGVIPTLSVLARIHNGGPRGYQKKSTMKYWLKVYPHVKKGMDEWRRSRKSKSGKNT